MLCLPGFTPVWKVDHATGEIAGQVVRSGRKVPWSRSFARWLSFPSCIAAAAFVGAAVFSHWVLDWLVHRPDLPLYDDAFKVGLGLWNYPAFAFVLEVTVLFGGMYLYVKTTKAVAHGGRYGMVIFGIV